MFGSRHSSLLRYCAGNGCAEEAYSLLNKGLISDKHVNDGNLTNTTPLHAACRRGDTEMVKLLLQYKADPNAKEIPSVGGYAPLHIAAEIDNLDIAELLLRANCNPSIRTSTRGSTPLHICAQFDSVDCCRLLLVHGGDQNLLDFSGNNPCYWAKELGNETVAKELEIRCSSTPVFTSSKTFFDQMMRFREELGIKPPKIKMPKAKGKAKSKAKKK